MRSVPVRQGRSGRWFVVASELVRVFKSLDDVGHVTAASEIPQARSAISSYSKLNDWGAMATSYGYQIHDRRR